MVAPMLFVWLDFRAGVRKAKVRGERITSDKWKRSVYKIARYYQVMQALLIVDAMQVMGFWYMDTYFDWSVPVFPVASLIGILAIASIEVKSILEPADEKETIEVKAMWDVADALLFHKHDPRAVAEIICKELAKQGYVCVKKDEQNEEDK